MRYAILVLLALSACATQSPPESPHAKPAVVPAPLDPAPITPAPIVPGPEPSPPASPHPPIDAPPAVPTPPPPVDPAPAKRPEPVIARSPEEQATDDVSAFLGAYVSAIKVARVRARELAHPVRIRVDREAHTVTLARDGADPADAPLCTFAYPASIEILTEPSQVTVMPDEVISFSGREFNHHPQATKDSAHVLARVPHQAPHAFLRFVRGKRTFMAQQVTYIDETGD